MKLDVTRLENVRRLEEKTIARCPACAASGGDKKGEHLYISDDGRFGCVAYPGEHGIAHRREIFAMAGRTCTLKRKCPPVHVRLPDRLIGPAQKFSPVDLARLGTVGTPFSSPRVSEEQDHNP